MVMATPFNPELKEFSDMVHRRYRDVFYCSLFGVKPDAITYDALPTHVLSDADRYFSVDCYLSVKFKSLRDAMAWTSSYRFRDAEKYHHYQDVTFTKFNHDSEQISELSKLTVNYFVYGYHSLELDRLMEAVIIDVPEWKKALAQGHIKPKQTDVHNSRSHQTFEAYHFSELKQLGLIVRHFKDVNGILVKQA